MYGFPWEKKIYEQFGSGVGVFLTEKLIRYISDFEKSAVNIRCATHGVQAEESFYFKCKEEGSVMTQFDTLVSHSKTGKVYRIGFNLVN